MFSKLARWRPPLFGRASNRRLIERLHGEIVAAARNRVLFTDFGIEDTFEGRFESVVLHAALVLRRLHALPAPGPILRRTWPTRCFAISRSPCGKLVSETRMCQSV